MDGEDRSRKVSEKIFFFFLKLIQVGEDGGVGWVGESVLCVVFGKCHTGGKVGEEISPALGILSFLSCKAQIRALIL